MPGRSRCSLAVMAPALIAVPLLGIGVARAQCGGMLPPLGLPGTEAPVHAAISWDPDGPGPQSPQLVIGGEFVDVSGVRVLHIAAWDGTAWRPLGEGVDENFASNVVSAMTVYNGELIVGGDFTRPGIGIAAWNGQSWRALGPGLYNEVLALTEYNGELIAGGRFAFAGDDLPVNGLARWNGTAWQPLGAGLQGDEFNRRVTAFAVYNGELIAAGEFTGVDDVPASNVAAWDGTVWRPMGQGLFGPAHDLAVHNGSLYAVDSWSYPPLRRWDGAAWQPVGECPVVYEWQRLALWDGKLVVASVVMPEPGVAIATWDGEVWQSINVGPVAVDPLKPPPVIEAVCEYSGGLFIGGQFRALDGRPVLHTALWDGDSWHRVGNGPDGEVSALAWIGGSLIAGGSFAGAGQAAASGIARWDGVGWVPLGGDEPEDYSPGPVSAVVEHSGAVVAAGEFTREGGASVRIARWDGVRWSPLGAALAGAGFISVNALAEYGGDLIAAGSFEAVGDIPVGHIARWDGTRWHSLGSGVAGAPSHQARVWRVAVYGNDLYAAGEFQVAGGVPAAGFAAWDGSVWRAVPGPAVTCNALVVHAGELIAAGGDRVTAWDGTAWRTLGGALSFGASELVSHRGELVGIGNDRAARWDGAVWHEIPNWPQLTGPITAASAGNEVFIAVVHATPPQPTVVTPALLRWSDTGAPWVARQPRAAAVLIGSDPTLAVTPAAGYEGLSYQWRRGGAAIADGTGGAAPGGGTVTGATTPALIIAGAQRADAGVYDCVVSNACGQTISAGAALAVGGACEADWNGDLTATSADISTFLTDWIASVTGGTLVADFDGSGGVTSADIAAFLQSWIGAVTQGC